jgi:hypothetical protein
MGDDHESMHNIISIFLLQVSFQCMLIYVNGIKSHGWRQEQTPNRMTQLHKPWKSLFSVQIINLRETNHRLGITKVGSCKRTPPATNAPELTGMGWATKWVSTRKEILFFNPKLPLFTRSWMGHPKLACRHGCLCILIVASSRSSFHNRFLELETERNQVVNTSDLHTSSSSSSSQWRIGAKENEKNTKQNKRTESHFRAFPGSHAQGVVCWRHHFCSAGVRGSSMQLG